MHFSTTVLVSFSLAFATSVIADSDTQSSPLGLTTKPVKLSKRAVPSILDTRQSCSGTCKTCFGSTYIDCPDSDYFCYDPAQGPASSQCSGGTSPPSQTSAARPGATGTGTETCSQKGASCQTCFGAGSVNCPAGSYYDCYEPAERSEADGCNKAGSGPPAPGSTGSVPPSPSPTGGSSQCAAQYGAGNILCGQDSCYNPTVGESCCGDGTHCTAGTECVLRGSIYKCRPSGSGSSDAGSTRTTSGIINTSTSIGVIGGGSADSSTSTTASRITRSTSATRSSTSTGTTPVAASTSSGSAPFGAAPMLIREGTTGVVAAVAAGLLALMGLL